MNKNQKWLVFWLTFTFFVIGMFYFFYGSNTTPGMYDDFAKCLTSNGVKMYGSFQCPHCADQKVLFGDSIKYVDYVECGPLTGPEAQVCKDANIVGYPTWKIGGSYVKGTQTLQDLAKYSNCKLPS